MSMDNNPIRIEAKLHPRSGRGIKSTKRLIVSCKTLSLVLRLFSLFVARHRWRMFDRRQTASSMSLIIVVTECGGKQAAKHFSFSNYGGGFASSNTAARNNPRTKNSCWNNLLRCYLFSLFVCRQQRQEGRRAESRGGGVEMNNQKQIEKFLRLLTAWIIKV